MVEDSDVLYNYNVRTARKQLKPLSFWNINSSFGDNMLQMKRKTWYYLSLSVSLLCLYHSLSLCLSLSFSLFSCSFVLLNFCPFLHSPSVFPLPWLPYCLSLACLVPAATSPDHFSLSFCFH